jgi:hypothetical protein
MSSNLQECIWPHSRGDLGRAESLPALPVEPVPLCTGSPRSAFSSCTRAARRLSARALRQQNSLSRTHLMHLCDLSLTELQQDTLQEFNGEVHYLTVSFRYFLVYLTFSFRYFLVYLTVSGSSSFISQSVSGTSSFLGEPRPIF